MRKHVLLLPASCVPTRLIRPIVTILANLFAYFKTVCYNLEPYLNDCFSEDGIATTSLERASSAIYHPMAIQTDGSVVAGPHQEALFKPMSALVHYTIDGTLDQSFDG